MRNKSRVRSKRASIALSASIPLAASIALVALLFCARPGLAGERGAFGGVGLVSEHAIIIEKNTFDDEWSGGLGFGGGTFGPPPVTNDYASVSPHPVPTELVARWFDFHRQRFFEATLNDPDLPKKVAAIKAKQPEGTKHNYTLVIAFGGKGEVQLWLKGVDLVYEGPARRFMELVTSVQGHYAEGDPARYKQYTDSWRKKGRLPQEPLKD